MSLHKNPISNTLGARRIKLIFSQKWDFQWRDCWRRQTAEAWILKFGMVIELNKSYILLHYTESLSLILWVPEAKNWYFPPKIGRNRPKLTTFIHCVIGCARISIILRISVCVRVCLYMCRASTAQMAGPILMKLGRSMYVDYLTRAFCRFTRSRTPLPWQHRKTSFLAHRGHFELRFLRNYDINRKSPTCVSGQYDQLSNEPTCRSPGQKLQKP